MKEFHFQNGDRLNWAMYDGDKMSRVVERISTYNEQLKDISMEIESVKANQWSVMLANYGYSDIITISEPERHVMLYNAINSVGWKKVLSKMLWLLEVYNSNDDYIDICNIFNRDYEWVKLEAAQNLLSIIKPCCKEDYDTIIMHDFGTLIWQDDYTNQYSTPLKANNITLSYVINSVLFYYKKTNKKPSRICMLDSLMYDSEKHIIYLQFGS